MKKTLIVLITILISISFVACSCNDPTINSSNYSEVTSESEEYIKSEFFVAKTETQEAFNSLICVNDIDYDYTNEEYDTEKIDAMIKHNQKYIDIWFDELRFSCENFLQYLDDVEKQAFLQNQEKWELLLEEETTFINEVFIRKEKYQVYMGSIFPLECERERLNRIRDRTLYIKYLQYCIETNSLDVQLEVSVRFKYKSKLK